MVANFVTITEFLSILLNGNHRNSGSQQNESDPQQIRSQQMRDLQPKRSEQSDIRNPERNL
jgi:hypothetical protein